MTGACDNFQTAVDELQSQLTELQEQLHDPNSPDKKKTATQIDDLQRKLVPANRQLQDCLGRQFPYCRSIAIPKDFAQNDVVFEMDTKGAVQAKRIDRWIMVFSIIGSDGRLSSKTEVRGINSAGQVV